MTETYIAPHFKELQVRGEEIGFTMPSDVLVGSLLSTLVASKPSGRFLELGTGIGLSLSWMVDGMDKGSKVLTIDNDPALTAIVQPYFRDDPRVEVITADGGKWIENYEGGQFDLIFADAWPGKYSHLEQTINLLKPGGLYVIDDMLPQLDWPDGHEEKAERLKVVLHKRPDLILSELKWSTGVMVGTKT